MNQTHRFYRAAILFVACWGTSAPVFAADEPEVRFWTLKTGHKTEATLVYYTPYDVVIRPVGGEELKLLRDILIEEDEAYLDQFPALEKDEPPQKVPWVKVEGKIKSVSGKTYYDIYGTQYKTRSKGMTIEVTNVTKAPVKVDLLWFFVAESVKGAIRTTTLEDLYAFDVEATELELQPGEARLLLTDKARKTQLKYSSDYQAGSKLRGLVVQAYWRGTLAGHWTSDHLVSDVAKSGRYLEEFRAGGNVELYPK